MRNIFQKLLFEDQKLTGEFSIQEYFEFQIINILEGQFFCSHITIQESWADYQLLRRLRYQNGPQNHQIFYLYRDLYQELVQENRNYDSADNIFEAAHSINFHDFFQNQ
ncbi:hypothetical protein ABPG74_019088 [Tetrahymena malaccensis]